MKFKSFKIVKYKFGDKNKILSKKIVVIKFYFGNHFASFSKKIVVIKFYFATIISVRSTLLWEKGRIQIRIRTCD